MRNFIISLICISVILCAWLCFSQYSSKMCAKCIVQADTLVYDSIAREDWDEALLNFNSLFHCWNSYKRVAYFFLDAKDINEINCGFAKSLLYIEANDVSNSSGEIFYLKNKISTLHQSDALELHNIF